MCQAARGIWPCVLLECGMFGLVVGPRPYTRLLVGETLLQPGQYLLLSLPLGAF